MEADMPLHALTDMALHGAAPGSCRAGLSHSLVLLHSRTATFQQLPELMSDSTHNRVFKSLSVRLLSLHRYPGDFAPAWDKVPPGIGIFRNNTPTSDCTFPLPYSPCDKEGQNTSAPLIYAYIIETERLVKGLNLHTRWDIKRGHSSKSIHNT